MMIRARHLVVGCLMLVGLPLAGGCASRAVQIDNPIPIARTEYDRVFEASVRVLRDYHFVVERQDRRFGIISTMPRAAASALEPWFTDNTTPYQTLDNTLNYDRRIVHVYLEKRGESETADAGGSSAQQLAEAGGVQVDYQLRVVADVQRRQIPPTNLHTAAVHSVSNYGYQGNTHAVLTEQGQEMANWRDFGRDELLEKRLVAQILAVAGRIQPLHDTNPTGVTAPSDAVPSPIEHVEPGEVPAPPTEPEQLPAAQPAPSEQPAQPEQPAPTNDEP